MNSNTPTKRSVACYFCNELFDEEYLQAHVKQCSQVLEPCRFKCGAYVTRRYREKHALECAKKKNRKSMPVIDTKTSSMWNLQMQQSVLSSQQKVFEARQAKSEVQQLKDRPQQRKPSIGDCVSFLETEVIALRSMLDKERTQRLQLQIQLQHLEKFNKEFEEQNRLFMSIIENIKQYQANNDQRHYNSTTQNKFQFDKFALKYRLMEEWKTQVNEKIESIKSNCMADSRNWSETERLVQYLKQRMAILEQIETEVEILRNSIQNDQFYQNSERQNSTTDYEQFKTFMTNEYEIISQSWNQQLNEIRNFRINLEDIDSEVKDIGLKYHAAIFEIRSNAQMIHEVFEKIDSIDKDVKEIKSNLNQVCTDFDDMQQLLCRKNLHNSSISCSNGRLLWKISDYSEKLTRSIEDDIVLKSPIFLSKPYGYTLRIELHLNGIGRWKGRHLIASLRVLKGDWDTLLFWPCTIAATVVLRDQNENKLDMKDIVKTILVKRRHEDVLEDIDETTGQSIFIPHSVIDKYNFVKNDQMFLDIIIKN